MKKLTKQFQNFRHNWSVGPEIPSVFYSRPHDEVEGESSSGHTLLPGPEAQESFCGLWQQFTNT